MNQNNDNRDWYKQPDRPEEPVSRQGDYGSPDYFLSSAPEDHSSRGRPAYNHSSGASSPYYGYSSPYGDPRQYRGRGPQTSSSLKVVIVCVLVLLVVIASAVIFGDGVSYESGLTGGTDEGGTAQNPIITIPDGDEDAYSDDYRDFFNEYYSGSATGTNSIVSQAARDDLTLRLSSAGMGQELTLQEIYTKCAPAVVAIAANVGSSGYSWGTGILFTEDGYIVTNSHILDGADSVTVTLYDDREYDARLIGYDSQSDIAILKIDATGLQYAEFAVSDTLSVGDDVVAIGNPLGEELRGTMTNGIISAINRDIEYNGYVMTLLQTNAAINEGNSGGPLINMYGQIIGITNMKMISYYSSIEGIGFAIPSVTIKEVVDELVETGYIAGQPTIGITVGSVPASAQEYYDLPDGLYVSAVAESSDAYAKGIREGDIVTHAQGEAVSTISELNALKQELEVGDILSLTVYRDGEIYEFDVVMMDKNLLYE